MPAPASNDRSQIDPLPDEPQEDWLLRIIDNYKGYLYATALSIMRNPDDAEDAMQIATLRAWRRIDQLLQPRAIVSWLQQIVRTTCLDMIRKQKRRPAQSLHASEFCLYADDDKQPAQQADFDCIQFVLEAIDDLPESLREVVQLKHFSHLSAPDISRMLNISENNCRVRLSRAYQKLRECPKVREALGITSEK